MRTFETRPASGPPLTVTFDHCVAQVVTWAVSSERVVGHLKGHTSTIRDVYCDPLTGQLASVAYDKTMRVYAQPGQEEEYKGTA